MAAPAIIGAKMSIEGEADKGVIGSECLAPLKFFGRMSKMGMPIRFEETLTKVVSVA